MDRLWSGVCALFRPDLTTLRGLGDLLGEVWGRPVMVALGVWVLVAVVVLLVVILVESLGDAELLSKLSQKEMEESWRRQLEELSMMESIALFTC